MFDCVISEKQARELRDRSKDSKYEQEETMTHEEEKGKYKNTENHSCLVTHQE